MSMLMHILKQAEDAARLAERAAAAVANTRGLRSGDRVYAPLVQEAEFGQGSAPSQNLVFTTPADSDFWAYSLALYPFCKVVDPVNLTPDEIVYRPTSFAGQSDEPGADGSPAIGYTDFNTLVDGTFALISEGEELQNVEVPMSAAYCNEIGKWVPDDTARFSNKTWGGASQTPGGLVFDIPLFIPRSKSLTLRITPTYLGIRTITETVTLNGVPGTTITRQHKYKIVAVLEGEKKVSAFR